MKTDIFTNYGSVITIIITYIIATFLPSYIIYYSKKKARNAVRDATLKIFGNENAIKEKYEDFEGTLDAWGHKLPKFTFLLTDKGVTPLFLLTVFHVVKFSNIDLIWYDILGWIMGFIFFFIFIGHDETRANKCDYKWLIILCWISLILYLFPW